MADRDDEGQHGYVYLVCFALTPLGHAKHYLGATGLELQDRMAAHRGERAVFDGKRPGRPARILAALQAAGGRFDLVRSWRTSTREAAFELERLLKAAAPTSGRWCPWCYDASTGDGARRLSRFQRPLVLEEWLYDPYGRAIMVPHAPVPRGETEASASTD